MEKLRDHVLDLRPIGIVSLAIAAIWSTSSPPAGRRSAS
jgi:hypothetical protein